MAAKSNISRFALYPTARAVWLLALGLPVALLIAVLFPSIWAIGAAWAAAIIGLILLDTTLAVSSKYMRPELKISPRQYVGSTQTSVFELPDFKGRLPREAEFKLTSNDRLDVSPETASLNVSEGTPRIAFDLHAKRRGEAVLNRLWSRWQGPLRLIWMQRCDPLEYSIAVVPDTQLVKDTAIDFFSRDAVFGQKIQNLRGEGSEFDALSEFLPGMDKRAIDWKHSARHNTLLAREYRTERNHNIVFALDSGYLLCEDMVDESGHNLTKLDRAISVALVMGYVSLKLGDRVGIYSFDKTPTSFTPPVSGPALFSRLQSETSKIDYSHEETNYAFGLSYLAQKLKRRSLVVVFTDFIDTTQSELMLETMTRLVKKHLVIFVAFRNQPLSALTQIEPQTADDVSRAVIAQSLLSEREIVLAKLSRMGVDVIDVDPDTLNADVVNRYLDLKSRDAI
ncbi:DUF58 domain-containing protein [Litorimonas haliclonae]|uniref:DUF58 domain-containing protein n=1 Tax=Litorimonas haliclonae TaxID=2081977 RepID=UPI0039EF796F